MTTLHEALHAAADYLQLNGEELVQFAEETPDFPHMPYGGMSIDREEGMFLYALARALKPEHALEIGAYHGVSSAHILAALDTNDAGALVSIDLHPQTLIPHVVRWSVVEADATNTDLLDSDFVYEDSAHEMPAVATILGKVKALNPRVVVSHDYYSDVLYGNPTGFQVRRAFEQTFGADAVLGVQWNGGMRGFGLWLNPDWEAPKSELAVEKAPPPKRPPAKKATAKK